MFAYCDNNPSNLCDPLGMASKVIELPGGWYCRIDPANTSAGTKRHIHIWKNGKSYAQNADGSPHDKGGNSGGKISKSLNRAIKRKTGWDYNSKFDRFYNRTVTKADGMGTTYVFADGVKVYIPCSNLVYTSQIVVTNTKTLDSMYRAADRQVGSVTGSAIYATPIIPTPAIPSLPFVYAYAPAFASLLFFCFI